jgi:broad specificity phosphatase PhoE
MEIILARHGETEWNTGEIFRGRADIELNETGIKQAELLGEYLIGMDIEAVYSSPLKRAVNTAERIAGRHRLKVRTTPDLIDFDFGEWQGMPLAEVKRIYSELYIKWVNSPEMVKMPGGESLNNVRERAIRVVEDVTGRHKGTVVLVAHRVVNKVLICALLGLDDSHFWNIRQDTCGISVFTCEDGRFILTRHNDTSHLKSLSVPEPADF